MMKNGIIREVQAMKLLSACGDETVENMKNNVQRIDIVLRQYLQQNDRILLASMINRLSPLEEVSFNQFNLEPSLIPPVKRFLSSVAVLKVGILAIEDTHLNHESLVGYSDIFRQCHTERIALSKCKFTKENLIMISKLWQSSDIQLPMLEIYEVEMSADLYHEIAFTLKSIGCNKIWFTNCNLTIAKLSEFSTGCKENDLILQRLTITDRTMPSEAYSAVAAVVKTTGCTHVVFNNCDLSKEKLKYFGSNCKEIHVSLPELTVFDRTMPPDAYSVLAAVVKSSKCTYVYLGNCDMSKEKLECFGMGCKENQVTLSKLSIRDGTMTSDVYCDVAAIISVTGCSTLFFGNCDLTKQKLECFKKAGKKNQLSSLQITDVQMSADAYREIAFTLKSIGCKEIQFEHCDLTISKLSEFYAGCEDNSLSLQQLAISDRAMPSEAYSDVAAVVKTTECTHVVFGNCDLSEEKLKSFGSNCKEIQVSLQMLGILDNSMEEDQYEILSHILKVSDCNELQLQGCCLTETKLQGLLRGCRNQNIQIQELTIIDGDMPADTYSALAAVIKFSKCAVVCFLNCKLSIEKLECFRIGCEEEQVSLQTLCIFDNSMTENQYEILTHILKLSDCKWLLLEQCCLTKATLQGLIRGCRNQNIQLQYLVVLDATLPYVVHSTAAAIVESSKCKFVDFGKCDSSKGKVECEENQVAIPRLVIDWSQSTLTEDEISALCDLTTFAVENLDLFTWDIDAKGTQILPNTLQIECSKMTEIRFLNGDVFTKSRLQEEPIGQALQNTRNQGNNTIPPNRNRNRPKRCTVTSMEPTNGNTFTKNRAETAPLINRIFRNLLIEIFNTVFLNLFHPTDQ